MDTPTESLHVQVISADETLYDGPAKAVTSENYKGPFDILGFHTNFISIIKNRVVIHEDDIKQKEFTFNRAIMRCFKNEVEVYLGL